MAPNLPKLRSPGRARKAPRYLCGHKGQIHGVAAAARARVLAATPAAAAAAAAPAGPAACTAGRERTEQRAGSPDPAAPPTSAAPAWQPRRALRAPLQTQTTHRLRGGAGRGSGASEPLHVTAPSPTPRAGPGGTPARAGASPAWGSSGETEAGGRPAGGSGNRRGPQVQRCRRPVGPGVPCSGLKNQGRGDPAFCASSVPGVQCAFWPWNWAQGGLNASSACSLFPGLASLS